MTRMRITVDVEDDHVRAVRQRYGPLTVDEAIDLALRTLAEQPMTRDEALAMRGAHAIEDLPPH